MVRCATCVLLALSALLVVAPYTVSRTDAVSLVSIGAVDDDVNADAPGVGGVGADDDDDDAYSGDEDLDEDEVDVADGDDEDAGGNEDEDSDYEGDEDDEDDDATDPAEDAEDDQDKPAVIDPPGEEKAIYDAPKPTNVVFFDDFQSGLSKWTHSESNDYKGKFVTGQGAKPTFRGDRALIIPEKARKYGLSTRISGIADLTDMDLVVQYELKVDQGITCGGSYIKLPLPDFDPKSLTGDTPYSIMFGPDKCGSTDKVHFIFQSVNPVTGKRVEHHLKTPPTVANSYDKKTHLYTLIVKKDSSFELLVDLEKKSYGSLSEKFEPPLQPPKEIDDPEDKKPADWVDEKKIADPEAKKPDDWDEDAPAEIPDLEAEKPSGWLDDEPEKVPDPEAKKPAEWDDSEDGEWEAPLVPNPKCEKGGCGEWKRPMKKNPDYKGKWKPPMIDNPKYIGDWKPRKIDNPEYYEVSSPKLLGIGGVAFEIWTMDQGVLFDNLFIGNDVEAALKFANETFREKQATELEREEAERKKEDAKKKKKSTRKTKKGKKDMNSFGVVMDRIEEAVDKLESMLEPVEVWLQKVGFEPYLDKMIDLGIQKPMIVVVSVPLIITLLMLTLLSSGKKKEREPASSTATEEERSAAAEASEKKKTDATTEDAPVVEESEVKAENIESIGGDDGDSGLRQRTVAVDES